MRRLFGFLVALLVLIGIAIGAAAFTVRRTLAPAGETQSVADLSDGPVTIEIDAAGVPTIHAPNEEAMAFAQAYAHARDRRFQMELFRRSASGRLSELVGAAALPLDRRMRRLGVPKVAELAEAQWSERRRRIFTAYAAGVNAYDRAHPAPPELLVLGVTLEPWRARDCSLVHFLMIDDLNSEAIEMEIAREKLDAILPPSLVAFLHPIGAPEDVVLDGSAPLPMPATPGADVVDLRDGRVPAVGRRDATTEVDRIVLGSNNWAVAPARSASGGALLAGDPHQGLAVPTLYHRQRLEGGGLSVTGITLPGVPGMIFGTNGAVAWSGTNVEGDFADLVRVEPADPETLTWRGPNGPEPFTVVREVIGIRNAPAETLVTRHTRFGPVVATSKRGGLLCAQWVALDPATYDMDLYPLNRARTAREFIALLGDFTAPALNFAVADSTGSIGWAIGGRVPARRGFDPARPRDGALAGAGWQGWHGRDSLPAVFDPPQGYLVTANQRTVGASVWDRVAGDPAMAWRARRIANVLASRTDWSVEDMAKLQCDIEDGFLQPTANALERALTDAAIAQDDTLTRVRALLGTWTHAADTTSVAHGYLREARAQISALLIDPLVAPVRTADSTYRYAWGLSDEVVRRLLAERPAHLLDPAYADYDALVRAAAKRAASAYGARAKGVAFDAIPWGRVNRSRLHHPLGDAVAAFGKFVNYPDVALAGGSSVVRVARARSGAAMRLAVDLSDRTKSRFALPGGQSGHFMSPHYGDGFPGWVAGTTVALEPGPAVDVITLTPATPASR